MKMEVQIKATDFQMENLIKQLRDLKVSSKSSAGVGFFAAKGGDDTHGTGKATVLQIAMAHEFGTKIVPQRSFIASTFERKAQDWADFFGRDLLNTLATKKDVANCFARVAALAASDIKATIRAGLRPPLSKATLKIRAKSLVTDKQGRLRNSNGSRFASVKNFKPLIDTGQLIRGITWVRKLVGL